LKQETAPPRTSGEDLQQARPQAEATKEAERAGIEHAKQMVIARYTPEQLSQMRRVSI
jgi:hypothetical protein